MDINDICNILLYDPVKFKMYLDYKKLFVDTPFLCFEEFLLCENNLKEYLNDSDSIIKKYQAYHEDIDIQDHECYELFCKNSNAFPYNVDVISPYAACKNCIYLRETRMIDSDYSFNSCMGDFEVSDEYVCDNHIFDSQAVKPLIRELRK